VEQKVR
jgi:hypothetical protein